jgi:hypothetical protein
MLDWLQKLDPFVNDFGFEVEADLGDDGPGPWPRRVQVVPATLSQALCAVFVPWFSCKIEAWFYHYRVLQPVQVVYCDISSVSTTGVNVPATASSCSILLLLHDVIK